MIRLRALSVLFLAALSLLAAPRPRLVVVVSVDQLSADLVARWGGDLQGGLATLLKEGTHFAGAFHEHGYTDTGPGHSVLLSGRHPGHTGITENYWYERSLGRWLYCVDDPDAQNLTQAKKGGASARWFRGTTLAGWVKDQIPGGRSFVVSGKDRSGILMAGPKADGVYWFENSLGFITSTGYAKALPSWMPAWNQDLKARLEDASVVWTPLDPTAPAPRGGRYELPGRTLTLGLPRLIKAVGMPMDEGFWFRFRSSPKLDETVLDFAERLLEAEGLGRPGTTDLLAVGLSATDHIGHMYGNSGPEMRDQFLRLDHRLGAFLAKVRQRDPGAWVVLTADHGCNDFCERLQEQGIAARRGVFKDFAARVEQRLASALGAPGPWLHLKNGSQQAWLREEPLKSSGRPRAEVVAAALAALRAQPELAGAWTAEELEALALDPATGPDRRSLAERIKLSQTPGRSGDLLYTLAPLFTFDEPPYIVSHGTAWDHDRRVPLVFQGPWRAERRTDRVRTVDLAPTLARELGISPPGPVDGRPLDLKPRPRP